MIEIRSLTKSFGSTRAVDDITLSVPTGAFLVLLGPSGCGKTTLLRMLAGLEHPSSGQIVFDGKTVSDGDRNWSEDPAKRNSGLVFQSYALWPHMTVRGNIDWPLKVAGMDKAARDQRANEVMSLLAISKLEARYPNEISGGQQQRVAIARTIAPRPGILLFDEPLSNLDAKLRVEMRAELMRLHRSIGATAVYVTHDQIEAMTMATHVAVLNEGRIEQFGTPAELIKRPASTFVAGFVGTPPANLLPVNAASEITVAGKTMRVNGITPDGRHAMYRPETITLAPGDTSNALPMEVLEVSPLAGRFMITATDGMNRLTAVVNEARDVRVAGRVYMLLPRSPECVFNADGRRVS